MPGDRVGRGGGATSFENVKKWLLLSLSQSGIPVLECMYKSVCLSLCV